jgi:hypothetical protein
MHLEGRTTSSKASSNSHIPVIGPSLVIEMDSLGYDQNEGAPPSLICGLRPRPGRCRTSEDAGAIVDQVAKRTSARVPTRSAAPLPPRRNEPCCACRAGDRQQASRLFQESARGRATTIIPPCRADRNRSGPDREAKSKSPSFAKSPATAPLPAAAHARRSCLTAGFADEMPQRLLERIKPRQQVTHVRQSISRPGLFVADVRKIVLAVQHRRPRSSFQRAYGPTSQAAQPDSHKECRAKVMRRDIPVTAGAAQGRFEGVNATGSGIGSTSPGLILRDARPVKRTGSPAHQPTRRC